MTEYEAINRFSLMLDIFSKDVYADLDKIYTFLERTGRSLEDKATRGQVRDLFKYRGWRTAYRAFFKEDWGV